MNSSITKQNTEQRGPNWSAIWALTIASTTAKRVVFRVMRDGVVLGQRAYAVEYFVGHPNECNPEECRSARLTFP